MTTQATTYATQRVDHLGIVAGVCRRIWLIKTIDEAFHLPMKRKVCCG